MLLLLNKKIFIKCIILKFILILKYFILTLNFKFYNKKKKRYFFRIILTLICFHRVTSK